MSTRRRSNPPNFRAGLDYFMAVAMIMFGSFIIFSKEMTGEDYFRNSQFVQGGTKWVIGILFMLYGVFRGYRGYLASKSTHYNDD